ncbi:MAG: hypothetical protein HYS77_10600 [Candidatus Rokubacteria bacterium]|nr:hypothetical protein [Candidatus Rokubacteria bacterium]
MATTLVAVTLTIALPFVAVFLLRSFEYSFAAITLVALVSQVGYAGSLRGWGYLSDHFGNRPILLISMGILVAYIRTPLYSTLWILLIGYVTRYLPYGQRMVSAALLSLSPELDQSSRTSGASWATGRPGPPRSGASACRSSSPASWRAGCSSS